MGSGFPVALGYATPPKIAMMNYRTFFLIILVVGTIGVVSFLPPQEPPATGDETFDLAVGERRGLNVDLARGGLDYRVEVLSGGPVDVYLVSEGGNPRYDVVAGQAYPNTTLVDEVVEDVPVSVVTIFIDNSDFVGTEPTADAVVRVAFEATASTWYLPRLAFCSVILILGACLFGYSLLVGHGWKRDRVERKIVTVVDFPNAMLRLELDRRSASDEPEGWYHRGFVGAAGMMTIIVVIGLCLAFTFIIYDSNEPYTRYGNAQILEGQTYTFSSHGIKGTVEYRVDVLSGGALDVLVVGDPLDPLATVIDGHKHIGVTEVEGTLRLTKPTDYSIIVDNTYKYGTPPQEEVIIKVVQETTATLGIQSVEIALVVLAAALTCVLLLNLWVAAARKEVLYDTRTSEDGTKVIDIYGPDVPRNVHRAVRMWRRSAYGPGHGVDLGDMRVHARYLEKMYEGDYEPTGMVCPRCGGQVAMGPTELQHFCPTCGWGPEIDS